MKNVTVKNSGPTPIMVSLYRCREDAWGRDQRESACHIHLAAGEEHSFEVSGDIRGGGSMIEVIELPK